PILVIVPPRTAAGSRSDPRLGLGVIYGDFGEAALLMHRTRQQVWCWLIGHDACFLCLSVHRSPRRSAAIGAGRPATERKGLPTSAVTGHALDLPPQQHAVLQPPLL